MLGNLLLCLTSKQYELRAIIQWCRAVTSEKTIYEDHSHQISELFFISDQYYRVSHSLPNPAFL